MTSLVATVEPNGQNVAQFRPTEPGASRTPAASPARFTYPSGSQALAGFTIKRGVGHGGFGEVYYAVSDAGKEVALKLIRRNLDIELRGIRHCLNLKHPNLLAIYDLRQDSQEDNWVVMEFVKGDHLEAVLAAHPNGLPVETALNWFFGIAAGVACLHDHGIVHRDLKPGNIFSDEGVVKLGDYGLSKFISCSRRSGQTESVGTVHYMAPEIANGRYGKEIDIYALGVILYEMLTGRVPFEGESVGEVLMKHLTTPPDVSLLAEPYRSVVAKALEKDPEKRYRTVPEMLAALPRPAQGLGHVGPLPSSAGGAESGGRTAPPPPPPLAQVVDEEPIWRAVRHGARQAHTAWNESRLNAPAKIILLMAGLWALLHTAPGWVPTAFTLVMAYAVYWVVRSLVLSHDRKLAGQRGRSLPPHAAPIARAPVASPAAARTPSPRQYYRTLHRRREAAVDALVLKSTQEQITDLVGSLLGSALVVIVMSVLAAVVIGFHGPDPRFGPEHAAWMLLVSLAGAWAVLIPSKFWEGREGDAILRRFILMVIGMGVGAVAFFAMTSFGVALPELIDSPGPHLRGGRFGFADPTAIFRTCLVSFATLFFVIRWWRLTDPLRGTRMSVWFVAVCVFFAWLTSLLWQFPMPWLMIVATITSVAVQLASPWVHPRVRRARSVPRE